MRFKERDIVECMDDTVEYKGRKGEVDHCLPAHNLVMVSWLDEKLPSCGAYNERHLKLSKPAEDSREQRIYKRLCNIKRPKPKELKKGDTVRIRSDLTVGGIYDGCKFVKVMEDYMGKEAVITMMGEDEEGKYYKLNISRRNTYWSGKMFEGVEG